MTEYAPLLLAIVVVAMLTAGAMAVRSVSRIRLRHLVESGMRGVRAAELYLDRPHRLLVSSGAGVALACVAAGVWIGARGLPFGRGRVVAEVVVMALATLFLGQVIPRVIARRYDAAMLPVLLPVLRVATLVTAPLHAFAWLVERGVRGAAPAPTAASAREGIEDLLREGEMEGVGEREEIAIISGVVDFAEKRLSDVMTARSLVFALDASLPPQRIAREIADSGYSRVPLFRGTLDDVVGMVHAFDVLKAGNDNAPALRPVARASADTACNALLPRMLHDRRHLAIVRDADDRTTLGIVTLEDLLEALVGDIRDEHDDAIHEIARDATHAAPSLVVAATERRVARDSDGSAHAP